MLPYKQKESGKILDSFREGVTWDMVYNLYVFDRKYSLLPRPLLCVTGGQL
ncbi:hypothetical protein [Tannerella forsythia]|uniref:hypothetical protein n=1 Tax=Tannerella forsythia TaxID=28112 RepID=UPI001F1BF32E|nr:hypothetical protein [Tannerella forsythia]